METVKVKVLKSLLKRFFKFKQLHSHFLLYTIFSRFVFSIHC